MSNELTDFDRQKLAWLLRSSSSLRAIAKLMGRNHTVLSREIQRNGGSRKKYRADTAERLKEKRKHQHHVGKLEKHPLLLQYVVDRLQETWSPEEIAGRLVDDPPPGLHGATVSHETIYYFIYTKAARNLRLHTFLRTHHRVRRHQGSRKHKKLPIPKGVSIHARPKYIAEKKRLGDWESDTVEFARGMKQGALSVQHERKTGLVRIHRMRNKSAQATYEAIADTFETLPYNTMKTITFDNGAENALHPTLSSVYGIQTYFCDPYASWQKGGVENTNKLIRQFLPRKTNLADWSDAEIYAVQERLNNRPRKRLGYKTPNELFNELTS